MTIQSDPVTKPRWYLRTVTEISTSDTEAMIRFANNEIARLQLPQAEPFGLMDWLQLSLRDGGPIALQLSPENWILEAGMAELTQVAEVCPNRSNPSLIEVWLGGHSGPLLFRRDFPGLATLLAQLEEAQVSQRWICVILAGGSIAAVLPSWEHACAPRNAEHEASEPAVNRQDR